MSKINISFNKVSWYLMLPLVLFPSFALANCFIIKELNSSSFIQKEGECQSRVAPCSTFKIPLALMGLESKILENAEKPSWAFKKEYEEAYHVCRDKWREAHNPNTWMKNSCIWYSQELTRKLGKEKFKYYVDLFNYGNKDLSGDPGKHNGLSHSWLSSSLKISPVEQIEFLTKMLKNRLPVSAISVELTKQILYVSDNGGWKIYGKTGTGYRLTSNGEYNLERQMGWFVGWINDPIDDKTYVFAYFMQDQGPEKTIAGLRAKEAAMAKISNFIEMMYVLKNIGYN